MQALRAIFLLSFVLLSCNAWSQPPAGRPPMSAPTPTNLKTLPKSLTGDQIAKIMFAWSSDLGVHCTRCHAVASDGSLAPNGRPRLNFADDSRPEEADARRMAALMEELNQSKHLKAGTVSCGTCHRGHYTPEPFAAATPQAGSPAGR